MDAKPENPVKAEQSVHFPFLQNGMHGSQLARNPFYDTGSIAPQKHPNDIFSGMNLSMQAFNTAPVPVKEEQLSQFNMSSCFNYSGLKLPTCHPGTLSQPAESISMCILFLSKSLKTSHHPYVQCEIQFFFNHLQSFYPHVLNMQRIFIGTFH
ncbi:hypothetical protein DICVIV_07185 [Dictyocaulus viviparus]|uniref:Uncharacterized protein n=1 Tax=Dictyocaulus viviparus TaxID=29172 RepID=A0A0D8XSQ3_DICVI|nr:hypothetical protein DICVIV_07185 [Dictyocaulus viviparus]